MVKAYEIRDMVKGRKAMKGMVATIDINTGDIILKESPQLVIKVPESETELPFGHIEGLVLEKYQSMNEANPARYDCLSYIEDTDLVQCTKLLSEVWPYDEEKYKVLCRFRTNAFEDNRGKWQYIALEGARINHACAANAIFQYDERDNTFMVLAQQKIAQGEEISIAYISPMETSEIRASYLDHIYEFECDCKICTSDPLFDDQTAIAMGDADRKLIEILGRARDNGRLPVEVDSQDQMELIKLVLERTQGMEALIPERFRRLERYIRLLKWTGLDTLPEAKEWFEEAYQLGTILRGHDHPKVISYAQALEAFPQ